MYGELLSVRGEMLPMQVSLHFSAANSVSLGFDLRSARSHCSSQRPNKACADVSANLFAAQLEVFSCVWPEFLKGIASHARGKTQDGARKGSVGGGLAIRTPGEGEKVVTGNRQISGVRRSQMAIRTSRHKCQHRDIS